MIESLATILLLLCAAYLLIGVAFAVPFVLRGCGRIDQAARGGTWGFRILILPGSAVFWPLLASRWLNSSKEQR